MSEALGALEVALTTEDLKRIETAIPRNGAAGGRYAAPQLAQLDSEHRAGS
jgi:hypothetical protein